MKKTADTMVTIIVGILLESDFHKPHKPKKTAAKENRKVVTASMLKRVKY
jgi:hypothetical protein